MIHAVVYDPYKDEYYLMSEDEIMSDHSTEILFVTNNLFKAEEILTDIINKGE